MIKLTPDEMKVARFGIVVGVGINTMILFMLFLLMLCQDIVGAGIYTVGVKNRLIMNTNNAEITDNVIKNCVSTYNSEFEVAKCINIFFKNTYKYVDSRVINSPDFILKNGGNCQGSAAWYDYALTSINAEHWFTTSPNHIFVSALLNNSDGMQYICSFDEGYMDCYINKIIV